MEKLWDCDYYTKRWLSSQNHPKSTTGVIYWFARASLKAANISCNEPRVGKTLMFMQGHHERKLLLENITAWPNLAKRQHWCCKVFGLMKLMLNYFGRAHSTHKWHKNCTCSHGMVEETLGFASLHQGVASLQIKKKKSLGNVGKSPSNRDDMEWLKAGHLPLLCIECVFKIRIFLSA